MQFIQTVQTHSSDIKIASFDAIITFICVMIGIACGQYGDVRRVNRHMVKHGLDWTSKTWTGLDSISKTWTGPISKTWTGPD